MNNNLRVIPHNTTSELVQWVFICGSAISIVALLHQIKLSRMQIAELKKKNSEYLSYLPADAGIKNLSGTGPVKVELPLPIIKKHEITSSSLLWGWYGKAA